MSDREASSSDDEVTEIKRAMKEARARKKSISSRLKQRTDSQQADYLELKEILRNRNEEISQLKHELSNAQMDLREARYENTQYKKKDSITKQEKEIQEQTYLIKINELRRDNDEINYKYDSIKKFSIDGCDRVIKLLNTIRAGACGSTTSSYKSTDKNNLMTSKSSQHILSKALIELETIKKTVDDCNSLESNLDKQVVSGMKNNKMEVYDSAMLEMCRNLEEENTTLANTVETLKEQLKVANRSSATNKLIPHYRLAIVRARTYAANLLEQINREQATSKALQSQLDATFADLKKVSAEKKKLYEKLTKEQLRNDQRNYHIDGRYDQVVSQDYLRVDQSSSFESKQKPTLDEPQKMMKTVGRGDDNYRKIRSPKSPSDPGFQLRRSFDNNNFPQHLEESRKDEVSATQPSEITFEGNSYGNDNDNEHHYRDKGGNRKTEVQIEDADDEMSSNNEIGVQLDEDVYKVARGFAKELGSSSLPLTEEQLKSELQSLDVEIESLKHQLEEAAKLKSQQIVTEVVDGKIHSWL